LCAYSLIPAGDADIDVVDCTIDRRV